MTNQQLVEHHGYSLENRNDFIDYCIRAEQIPLMARALKLTGRYVLFDKNDDDKGFLLVGDDPESLAAEAVEHLELEV